MRTCPVCGTEFVPKKRNHTFDKQYCRLYYHTSISNEKRPAKMLRKEDPPEFLTAKKSDPQKRRCRCGVVLADDWARALCLQCEVDVRVQRELRKLERKERVSRRLDAHNALTPQALVVEE